MLGFVTEPGKPASRDDSEMRALPIDLIQRGRYQPRMDMRTETLQELAESIRAQGIVQPVVVRRLPEQGRYELIAGERRWRAAQIAGLQEIPAVIREVPDQAAMSMALIENIQREQLNALEEAAALSRLVEEFGLTHQEAAEAIGRSRAAVSNLLRLLDLAEPVKRMLEVGDIEMGHARALLALSGETQVVAANRIVSSGMSVRDAERLVRQFLKTAGQRRGGHREKNADIRRLEHDISERLGAKVEFRHGSKGKGRLTIRYNSLDELDGILAHIK